MLFYDSRLWFLNSSFIFYLKRKWTAGVWQDSSLCGFDFIDFSLWQISWCLTVFMNFCLHFGGKDDPSMFCPNQFCSFFTVMTCFHCPTVPGRLLLSGRHMSLWSVGVFWQVWGWTWPSWFAPFCCEDSTRTWLTVQEITWRCMGSNSSGSLFRPRLVHVCC